MADDSIEASDVAPTGGPPRVLTSAIAAFLVIGNLYVIAQPGPAVRSKYNPLPQSRVLRDMFLLPGMFNSYSTRNLAPFLGGRRTQQGYAADRGEWIKLDVAEHLPHRRGVNFTRLYALHHRDMWGQAGQQAARAQLAARIRERHNRMHPARPVDRIRFGMLSWPKSPEGFEARRVAAEIEVETYYADPEPP